MWPRRTRTFGFASIEAAAPDGEGVVRRAALVLVVGRLHLGIVAMSSVAYCFDIGVVSYEPRRAAVVGATLLAAASSLLHVLRLASLVRCQRLYTFPFLKTSLGALLGIAIELNACFIGALASGPEDLFPWWTKAVQSNCFLHIILVQVLIFSFSFLPP